MPSSSPVVSHSTTRGLFAPRDPAKNVSNLKMLLLNYFGQTLTGRCMTVRYSLNIVATKLVPQGLPRFLCSCRGSQSTHINDYSSLISKQMEDAKINYERDIQSASACT